jgi:hypothetical protein
MSNAVNTINCAADWANTGFGDCPWHMLFEGMIQVPKDATFTEQQLATLVAHATTKAKEANSSNRFYPWPQFIAMEPGGGEPNKEELDNGSSITTWENDYAFTGQIYEGGVPVNNFLRTRNGQDIYFIGYGRGYAFGTIENGVYKGFKAKNYWSNAQKPGAYKTRSQYVFGFNVDVKDLNENVWYVKAEGIEDVPALKTLELKVVSSPAISATGVVDCSLKLKGYGTDYVAINGAAIAALTFTAKNKATGAAITVTSVAVASGNLRFDLDHTDTDYPASTGVIVITGPSISALEGAGTLNAEILPVEVTVP